MNEWMNEYEGDQIKEDEMVRAMHGRKPDGKWPLGRLKHRLKDNIKTNLTEIEWDGIS
jgi:hypothetical protein